MGNQQDTPLCISKKECMERTRHCCPECGILEEQHDIEEYQRQQWKDNYFNVVTEIKLMECTTSRQTRQSNVYFASPTNYVTLQRCFCLRCGEPTTHDKDNKAIIDRCMCVPVTVSPLKLCEEQKQYIHYVKQFIHVKDISIIVCEYTGNSPFVRKIMEKNTKWTDLHLSIKGSIFNDIDLHPTRFLWQGSNIDMNSLFCGRCGDPELLDENKNIRCKCKEMYYCVSCNRMYTPSNKEDIFAECECGKSSYCRYCENFVFNRDNRMNDHYSCKS